MVFSALIDTLVRFMIWGVVAGAFGYYALLMAGWTHEQIMELYHAAVGTIRPSAPAPQPLRPVPSVSTFPDDSGSTEPQPEGLDLTPEEEVRLRRGRGVCRLSLCGCSEGGLHSSSKRLGLNMKQLLYCVPKLWANCTH
jgi:hypothetical protein